MEWLAIKKDLDYIGFNSQEEALEYAENYCEENKESCLVVPTRGFIFLHIKKEVVKSHYKCGDNNEERDE